MARKTEVGGSVVREWANSEAGQAVLAEKGLAVGLRGKFSEGLLEQFHKANPRQKYVTGHVPTRSIQGTRVTDGGRKIPVKVNATLTEVREFAKAQGLPVGTRGRISAEVFAAFAATPRS